MGSFHHFYEHSGKVIGERRMKAMRDLGTQLSLARKFSDLWHSACEVLFQLEYDLPYAAAYSIQAGDIGSGKLANKLITFSLSLMAWLGLTVCIDSPQSIFLLEKTMGLPFNTSIFPERILLDDCSSSWPLAEMCASKTPVLCNIDSALLSHIPRRGHPSYLPRRAALLPVCHGEDP
jgi:hypothetical protein